MSRFRNREFFEFWDSGILEFRKKRILPADHADWRGLKRKRILGFWDSGIQEEKNIARGSRGLTRIEEEENSGIPGFWDSGVLNSRIFLQFQNSRI
jgi:hypothetical protein